MLNMASQTRACLLTVKMYLLLGLQKGSNFNHTNPFLYIIYVLIKIPDTC